MIRLGVFERSTDRGHNPPPPVQSLSSSTLSPLAPPFTVDRWIPAAANPDSLPPPPLTGSISPYFATAGDSVWSSSSAGGSRLTNLNSVEATPYYPYYGPALDSVDGALEKLSNYKGYAGGWRGSYDLEEGRPARGSVVNSSWTDSVLKKRGTVDSFSAYEDSFGSWHGAHNESSLNRGNVGSECSKWIDDSHLKNYVDKSWALNDGSFPAELDSTVWPNEGSSYFYSPETTSVVKECDTFIPSSYDRYISQLASCSRDTEVHYPAQTCASRQACVQSNERNESVLSCVLKHGNSAIKHANLHRKNDDFADYVIGTQNEAGIYENSECGDGIEMMGTSGDAMQGNRGTPDSSLQMKGLLSGSSSVLGQSIDCLQDLKFGLKVANLNCCKASNSERDAFIPDHSMQTSQELPDHLNVAVDSPCWKGASMSNRYSFSSSEIVQPLVINVSSGSDNFVQGQKFLNIHSDMEEACTFVCNENGKDTDISPVTNFSGSDIKFQDRAEKESNASKVKNAKEVEQHDIRGEHTSVLNEQVSVPQTIDDHVSHLSQEENIICKAGSNANETTPTVQNSDFVFNHISTSSNRFSSSEKVNASNGEINLLYLDAIPAELKKLVSSDPPSKCLSQGQDSHVLIKAMVSLSEVLLCQYCNEDQALEEYDLKPMQHIIDNLEAVILRNRKRIAGSSSRISGSDKTQPDVKDSTAEVRSPKVLMNAKENKNATSSGLNYDKHDNIVKSFNANFKLSEGIAQEEEDPNVLLYKNLWVQTEATLCSLKHDVALMKLEMKNLKHLFKAKSQASSDVLAETLKSHDDALNYTSSISVDNPSRSNTEIEQNHKQNISKNDEIDTSVFARYRILKSREPQRHNDIKSYAIEFSPTLQSHNVSKFTENISGEKLPAFDHMMGTGLFMNNKSTESAGVQESHLLASDASMIQSYKPRSHGKWLFSSGSDSPSAEWEHVLKDEFIW